MYNLGDYRGMIEDPVRAEAYARALVAAIKPGDRVVEIGTGVGYFAVLACRAGAARVYAIDPNPAIHLGPELARANGCADRIQFIEGVSTRVELEPVDVLVSDLRGVLPLWGRHIPDVIDARRRLLKRGGVQIPGRDTMWLALARAPGASDPLFGRPDPNGIVLEPLDRAVANSWWKERVGEADLLSEPTQWLTLDYASIEGADAEGTVDIQVTRAGDLHGFSVWFDTELFGGHGFSNAPARPKALYGQAFFPLAAPTSLEPGDTVRVTLRAKLVGEEYVWSWRGRVLTGSATGREFAHSTFQCAPLSPESLRKRADSFRPTLGREGEAQAWILVRMGEGSPLGAIAREAMARFPGLFRDPQDALTRVADLSASFSE